MDRNACGFERWQCQSAIGLGTCKCFCRALGYLDVGGLGRLLGRHVVELHALRFSGAGHQVAGHHAALRQSAHHATFSMGIQRRRLDFVFAAGRPDVGLAGSGFANGLGLSAAITLGGGRLGLPVCCHRFEFVWLV